ncbi:MAG: hypothetical protein KJ954_13730 [Alphaproteobacteria bacterium]|nr:hypothetical protein [Alphaproteobacteria bacterium]
MAKIHILEADHEGNYRMVIHSPIPTGNNFIGLSWKIVGLASGMLGSTILTEGTGIGQITTAEKAQINSGDLKETVVTVKAESGGGTIASINAMVYSAISDDRAKLQRQLKYYGFTNG